MIRRKIKNKAATTDKAKSATPAHKRKKPRKSSSRGALLTVMLLFLLSGLIRLGGETGQALAKELSSIAANTSEATQDMPQTCEPEAGISDLLTDLQTRQTRIEARERYIEERMQALSIAEVAYTANLERLIAAENALAATMARSETAAEDDLTRLTSVYENMKPKDAAALFETMDNEFAAGFLGRMRPDAAAAVFAGLDPETAYRISIFLAGRNANAPRE